MYAVTVFVFLSVPVLGQQDKIIPTVTFLKLPFMDIHDMEALYFHYPP
jgi:hypothetical protein